MKVIAARLVVAHLEGIQGNPIAEQTHAEMKFVPLPGRIGHFEWLELDVLKVDPVGACDLFIEAAATELAIAALNGAVTDAVTDCDRLPAGVAGVRRSLDVTHLIPSRRANSAVAAPPRSKTDPPASILSGVSRHA